MDLLLARHPGRLDASRSIIEEEFVAYNLQGRNAAVAVMIGMLRELHRDGRACRFIRPLKGFPLSELKPKVRGKARGGARVYFWILDEMAAAIVNCEIKANDAPASREKLRTAFEVYVAYHDGVAVLQEE